MSAADQISKLRSKFLRAISTKKPGPTGDSVLSGPLPPTGGMTSRKNFERFGLYRLALESAPWRSFQFGTQSPRRCRCCRHCPPTGVPLGANLGLSLRSCPRGPRAIVNKSAHEAVLQLNLGGVTALTAFVHHSARRRDYLDLVDMPNPSNFGGFFLLVLASNRQYSW